MKIRPLASKQKGVFFCFPAFTLTELLIVVAIIGILAALLLAAIGEAKRRAQLIGCAGNLGQCGVALQAFVTDYNAFPLTIGPPHSVGIYWMSALQNTEISSPGNAANRMIFSNWAGQGVWKCPAANTLPPWPTNKHYFSYGYNALGLSARSDTDGFLGLGGHGVTLSSPQQYVLPVKESEVRSPAEMMAIGDGLIGGNGIVRDGELILWRSSSVTNYEYPGCTERALALHQGRANVVHGDGHVESPTLKYLFEDTGSGALSRWNRDHQPHAEKL